VADVGTDHGALACALVQSGRVPRVVATDVAQGPLDRARARVLSCGLDAQVALRLGDGLGPIEPGEVQTVVICGMGGETIGRILGGSAETLATVSRLVLSPHTAVPGLRRRLVSSGWTDVDAALVEDRGHWYPVTAWERGQDAWTEGDYRWGRLIRARPDPMLQHFLRATRARIEAALSAARAGRGHADPAVRDLEAQRDQLTEELARLDQSSSSSPTPGAQ
jgi:tRNA (adenine22-N1)-methyltransferase